MKGYDTETTAAVEQVNAAIEGLFQILEFVVDRDP
jgi:hypothetical protein